MEKKTSIKAIFKGYEKGYAILDADGLKIPYPAENFPKYIHEGETVIIKIQTEKNAKEEEYQRLRELLTELIN